jgi:hypothetical protein
MTLGIMRANGARTACERMARGVSVSVSVAAAIIFGFSM